MAFGRASQLCFWAFWSLLLNKNCKCSMAEVQPSPAYMKTGNYTAAGNIKSLKKKKKSHVQFNNTAASVLLWNEVLLQRLCSCQATSQQGRGPLKGRPQGLAPCGSHAQCPAARDKGRQGQGCALPTAPDACPNSSSSLRNLIIERELQGPRNRVCVLAVLNCRAAPVN